MKQYTKAELEILLLETKDVLTSSGQSPFYFFDDPNNDEFGNVLQ